MPIIEVKDVEKVYKIKNVETKALNGVSVSIEKGEFTAFVGPSGSGKTTLFNIIGSLDVPTKGKVFLDGEELSNLSRSRLASIRLNKLGFVFQAYNLIPVLTALENGEFIMMLKGIPKDERRKKVIGLLDEVGLKGMYNKKPDELSGGQQQRVAVIRALAPEPEMILADEPTANLDSHSTEELMRLMRKLNEESGITFIFATHDQLAMKYAKRIIYLRDGKVEKEEWKD